MVAYESVDCTVTFSVVAEYVYPQGLGGGGGGTGARETEENGICDRIQNGRFNDVQYCFNSAKSESSGSRQVEKVGTGVNGEAKSSLTTP